MQFSLRPWTHRGHFANRRDAGRQLAAVLAPFGDRRPVVLALPRGGVPVGFEIAMALAAPLDILFVRKLGAPDFPELGLGAVVGGPQPQRVLNPQVIEATHASPEYIEAETRRQLELIAERQHHYRGDRPPLPIAGRTVILTDDGIATGGTVRAGLKALAQAGVRETVLAVPVAPEATLEALADEADETICLLAPSDFHSVGYYYADFEQTPDAEVIELLAQFARAGSP